MSLSLPPDLHRFAQGQLSGGNYASENEFLAAAVLALREKKLAELKALVQVGIDQADRGEGTLLEDDVAIDEFIDSLGEDEPGEDEK